ncbi:hypothetical protein Bca4012_103031 [Brassica carinata]
MQPSCAQVSPKHPDGALTPERAAHSCVHGYHGSWLDIIHPFTTTAGKDLIEPASLSKDSPRKGQRVDMCTNGQSSWAKITQTVHADFPSVHSCSLDGQSSWLKSPNSPRKGQRVDMCTDSSWAKITHGQSSRRKITHDILRGLKSPTDSPRKGQRVDMRIDDSPRGRKSPTDSPRRRKSPTTVLVGENHPRIVHGKGQRVDMRIDGQSSWAKITRQSTEGPTC